MTTRSQPIFVTEEKRSWMRLRSHTVVFERDPDFDRFRDDPSGSILSVLRIWVTDSASDAPCLRHYLGSVRHCECGGWMSRRELYRLFRRATTTARSVGERGSLFRARLSKVLRKRFQTTKTRS